MNTNIEQKTEFSIVIASLGGIQLSETIKSIYKSSVLPREIIIVIPEERKDATFMIYKKEINYYFVNFKGQVAQRIHGFNIAKERIVIQLDDDIELDLSCFEILISNLSALNGFSAVGPYFHYNNYEPVYKLNSGLKAFIKSLQICFLGGGKWGKARLGTIGGNGVGYGVDFSVIDGDTKKTEWLAGGCVAHFNKNLLRSNYFTLPGKAYGEDLMQSILLSKKGIDLYVIKNAICFIEKPILNSDNYNLRNDYLSRKQIIKMKSQMIFRLKVWYLLRTIHNWIKI